MQMCEDELLAIIESAIKAIVKHNQESESHWFVNVQTVLQASEINTSSASFRRLCNSVLGKAPLEAIHEIRLNMANNLLSTTLPIEDIAQQCGFSDHGKFTKKFKAHTGITPSEYRNAIRKNKFK